jgi:hypothetical protein
VSKTWKISPEFQNHKIERKKQWPPKEFFLELLKKILLNYWIVEENFSSLDKWLFWIIFLIEAQFMKQVFWIPVVNKVPMNYFAPYIFSRLEKSHTHGDHEWFFKNNRNHRYAHNNSGLWFGSVLYENMD